MEGKRGDDGEGDSRGLLIKKDCCRFEARNGW